MLRPQVTTEPWAKCLVRISPDHYIVDTRDFRHDYTKLSFIEEVRNGHVINRVMTTEQDAPNKIVRMLRNISRWGRSQELQSA